MKIRQKIRLWLGVQNNEHKINRLNELYSDLVAIGADVHVRDNNMIFIFSNLRGGQIRHIPMRFDTIKELDEFVRMLKARYRTKRCVIDALLGIKQFFQEADND